ncbi:hypothetical protein AB1K62_00590 [Parasphingorhabdus sp. JC815]
MSPTESFTIISLFLFLPPLAKAIWHGWRIEQRHHEKGNDNAS